MNCDISSNFDDDKSKIMPNNIQVDYFLSLFIRAFRFTLFEINWVKNCEWNQLKCSLIPMKINNFSDFIYFFINRISQIF